MSADPDRLKERTAEAVRRGRDATIDLSHRIHARPELGHEEVEASRWLAEALTEQGYEVEAGVCDLPTAFRARIGSGSLDVGLMAEYDALPGIGHACGHNMIASAAYATARALAPLADELDLTVTVLGTPAEEVLSRGGKIMMLERGAFEGVQLALMIHPSPYEHPAPQTLAATTLDVAMTGRAAHASAAPQEGVNAADALTVAQVAIGLLRQHLRPDVRVSGITRSAGEAPNIIPDRARAEYVVRATTLDDLAEVRSRAEACFQGGALATGCRVELGSGIGPYAELRQDPDLAASYRENATAAGREFAPDEAVARFLASTDAGNVSHVIPTLHPFIGLDTLPVVNHQADFAAACATPAADDALLAGAALLAATVVDAATRPELRARLIGAGRS
ncbi:amidohydrolase [Pseudonocardia adelaidensis]|uniref:Peptidase M20 domain-containing protein 2 n=1 Tax=Pseudonocardia adelaidensis TaxID=648754 RepID=A0ABP9NA25_9PSEU